MKFVDVKNDVAFRKIFGNENRTEALISFLNAILCLNGGRRITQVTIVSPYQLPELRGGKVTIVDLRAKDQNGNTYIVEMQVAHQDGFHKRVLYYASKSYSSQISRAEDYANLMPTLFIGILDFIATKSDNFISRHTVKNAETGEHFITGIEFTFIELPKFNKQADELHSIIDQWIYFIKNAKNLHVIPPSVEDNGLKQAYEEADQHNWTSEELDAYEKIFHRELIDNRRVTSAVKMATQEVTEKVTKRERDNFAKTLIDDNIPINKIAEYTGLTLEQIETLRGKS